MLYIQGRNDSLAERAHMLLIGEMLSSPFYTSLRTEKQLGYVVAAFANNHVRVPGVAMLVQSSSVDERALRAEFDHFLSGYVEQIEKMNEDDLKRFRASVLSNLQETPKNLADLNGRFIESVSLGYTDFDFREQLAKEVMDVTLSNFKGTYKALLVGEIRGLSVKTVGPDEENTATDLREQGEVYQYDF